MTENHSFPITPPPELVVQEWKRTAPHPSNEHEHYHYITLCAAQWGADTELQACCEWLEQKGFAFVDELRAARRPKPPSLKEQALEAMHRNWNPHNNDDFDTIRRALEALPDD